MRDPESTRNHCEEIDYCSSSLIRNRYCFDPLVELVDCDEQMSVIAAGGSGQRANHVEPPLGGIYTIDLA